MNPKLSALFNLPVSNRCFTDQPHHPNSYPINDATAAKESIPSLISLRSPPISNDELTLSENDHPSINDSRSNENNHRSISSSRSGNELTLFENDRHSIRDDHSKSNGRPSNNGRSGSYHSNANDNYHSNTNASYHSNANDDCHSNANGRFDDSYGSNTDRHPNYVYHSDADRPYANDHRSVDRRRSADNRQYDEHHQFVHKRKMPYRPRNKRFKGAAKGFHHKHV